jgi:hypothetical protein
MLKIMKTNDHIPQCALAGTLDMVGDDGYDSLLDDSAFARDMKLNKRYNDRELAEYRRAVGEGEESDDDEEDDKPISSQVHNKKESVITEEEEFEF